MSFQANYSGICRSCGEYYSEGAEIRSTEDDGWVHAPTCPEPIDFDEPQRNERRCPECFTIHAGECL